MTHESAQVVAEKEPVHIDPGDIQLATEFARTHPHLFPHKSTLHWMLRNRNSNGLSESGAVLLINGRTYLVVPKFLEVLLSKAT